MFDVGYHPPSAVSKACLPHVPPNGSSSAINRRPRCSHLPPVFGEQKASESYMCEAPDLRAGEGADRVSVLEPTSLSGSGDGAGL